MTLFLPHPAYRRRDDTRPRKAGGKRKAPEHKFQVALAKELRRHARCLWWAVPNGGYRNLFTATKLQAEGVRRGVPDLHFLLPGGRIAFLELKAPKGVLSPEQKAFRDQAFEVGADWAFAKTIDEAWDVLAGWGVLPGRVTQPAGEAP